MKEKPPNQNSAAPSTSSSSGGVRSAAARLLGAGNGSRALSFVGGNGASRGVSGSSRIGGPAGASAGSSCSQITANYDGKGTYLIFNAADTLFISDLNSHDKVSAFTRLLASLCCCMITDSGFYRRIRSSPSILATRTRCATPLIPRQRMGMICSLGFTPAMVGKVAY